MSSGQFVRATADPARAQTLADFVAQPATEALDAARGDLRQFAGKKRLLVMKTGKNQLQQILADRADGPFGRDIDDLYIIEAADVPIRSQQAGGDAG